MEIRAFRGWHYCGPGVSTQIAPPYDILDQNDKDTLLAADATNIVAVDLPHVPPKELGPAAEYQAAATLLSQWQEQGVLCQDEEPALYAYEQSYTWAGKTYARRAMLCGLRATPLGQDVIPHEHTFAGPKADRLKLTTVTKVQLSPIFGFYKDPFGGEGLTGKLWAHAPAEPTLQGELNGVTEKLWVVTDPGVIAEITEALLPVKAYIADGHHRYSTTMNYGAALRDAGLLGANAAAHEANFVLFALVAGDDAGLLVLPTHRLIHNLSAEFSLDALREALPAFTWSKAPTLDVDLGDADSYLAPLGVHAMAFVVGEEMWIGTLTDPAAMQAVAPDECDDWRELDVAILQELVIDRALAAWKTDATEVTYTADGNAARDEARRGEVSLSVIMQGTPLAAVESVANAGASMPHKSTYFYPKIATGMILKPLE